MRIAYLAQPDTPLAPVVARQIAMFDQQIEQASRLRDRLAWLHAALLDDASAGRHFD